MTWDSHLFFPHAYLIDPAPFIKKTTLSPLHCGVTFIMNQLTIYVCVCFCTL